MWLIGDLLRARSLKVSTPARLRRLYPYFAEYATDLPAMSFSLRLVGGGSSGSHAKMLPHYLGISRPKNAVKFNFVEQVAASAPSEKGNNLAIGLQISRHKGSKCVEAKILFVPTTKSELLPQLTSFGRPIHR